MYNHRTIILRPQIYSDRTDPSRKDIYIDLDELIISIFYSST